MQVHFHIKYKTIYGERIIIQLFENIKNKTDDNGQIFEMDYNGDSWETKLSFNENTSLYYRYRLISDHNKIENEAGSHRVLHTGKETNIDVFDEWRSYNNLTPFYSSAFTGILFKREQWHSFICGRLVIKVFSLNITAETSVLITGNCSALGNWMPDKSPGLMYCGEGVWGIALVRENLPTKLEYKFLHKKITGDEPEYVWEEGLNREVDLSDETTIFINHNSTNITPLKPRFAGTAIPVFSLRSRESCGIGDFGDLFKMVDLLKITSQNILQILPVNDTTSTHSVKDSYPYNSISVFALHPLYLNLQMAGEIMDAAFMSNFRKEADYLNSLSYVDYNSVERVKWSYIKKLYEESGESVLKSNWFKVFYKTNLWWLLPYSIFCHLRDRFGTADFREWPQFSKFNLQEVESFALNNTDCLNDIKLHSFVQFLLFSQLVKVREYAAKNRVILKGDLPIGINRNSVDAWTEPELFNFDMQCGAPPDQFSQSGQNWGFPSYRWDIMAKDGYSWWGKRLSFMSLFFDAYRIDHVLGFFRMWEIPAENREGIFGHFNPSVSYSKNDLAEFNLTGDNYESVINLLFIKDAYNKECYVPRVDAHNIDCYKNLSKEEQNGFNRVYNHYYFDNNQNLWAENGFLKLQELLTFSNMLVCAEDLGLVPRCVPQILAHFKILSLEIQRFSKESRNRYSNVKVYPYFSVCSTGTHDTSTLRGWIRELAHEAGINREELYLKENTLNGNENDISRELITIHLHSPSMLVILPLQDWFAMFEHLSLENPLKERINIPSDPNHQWKYRMHIPIDDLINDTEFVSDIKTNIKNSGRGL